MQTFIIDHTDKKNLKTKKKKLNFFLYIQRTPPSLAYFPLLWGKIFFSKNLAVIHNTTWAPNTMLNSPPKNLKSSFDENF